MANVRVEIALSVDKPDITGPELRERIEWKINEFLAELAEVGDLGFVRWDFR